VLFFAEFGRFWGLIYLFRFYIILHLNGVNALCSWQDLFSGERCTCYPVGVFVAGGLRS